MLLHKEEAIIYNYLTKIKLKQLYCHFKHLFIQRLAKVLKRAGYCRRARAPINTTINGGSANGDAFVD
jgi:hypothetical protein